MRQEHREALGIDESMTVRYVGRDNVRTSVEDIDISYYEVFDTTGVLVAKCQIYDSMGTYPPHSRLFKYKKFSPLGKSLL